MTRWIPGIHIRGLALVCSLWTCATLANEALLKNGDRILADFEGRDYGDWVATGDAFGKGPATGALPRQRTVSGFKGKGLVNTFLDADQSTGTLTSPPIVLDRDFLHVLVGGGRHPGITGMDLLVGGKVVASLTGENRETLQLKSIDLKPWRGKSARIVIYDQSKSSWGHINLDHLVLSNLPGPISPELPASPTKPAPEMSLPPFPTTSQRKTMEAAYKGMTMEAQRASLATDPEVIRYRVMRQAKAGDRYRPLFHLSTPEGLMNDPNGFCFWNGTYHLFYQLQAAGTSGMQWAHAVSPDLVQWQDLPLAIRQEEKSGRIFSGQVMVEPERVIAMFHDTSFGNCIALADDPLLLAFAKTGVNQYGSGSFSGEGFQRLFDPCIWKGKDGAYYSVSGVCKNGGRTGDGFPVADLFRSEDLEKWTYLGTLLDDEDWTRMGLGAGDDAAVPNFQPIAHRDGSPSGKHMFLWFSHGKGAHALVGTYDEDAKHFSPERYQRLTYGPVYKGTLHAPSAMVDPDGRLLAVFNIRENMQDVHQALNTRSPLVWYGIMSLVRHFWVDEHHQLRMEPAGDLASLRSNEKKVSDVAMATDVERVLEDISGSALELHAVIDPMQAERVGVNVLRSPDGREVTRIFYDRGAKTLVLDVSEGSQQTGVPARAAEIGPFELRPGEKLDLRIFVDRSVVEVFANERQALTARVYPGGTDSEGISVFAEGGAARLLSLDAWQMRSVWSELIDTSSH